MARGHKCEIRNRCSLSVCRNKPAGLGGEGAPTADSVQENDVPLTQEAIIKGCRALHGSDVTGAALSRAPRNSGMVGWFEPVIDCNTAGGVVVHKASEVCPKLSGTPDWYLTDFGRGTWMR